MRARAFIKKEGRWVEIDLLLRLIGCGAYSRERHTQGEERVTPRTHRAVYTHSLYTARTQATEEDLKKHNTQRKIDIILLTHSAIYLNVFIFKRLGIYGEGKERVFYIMFTCVCV